MARPVVDELGGRLHVGTLAKSGFKEHALVMETQRHEHLVRFYSILEKLEDAIGGARKLADCFGRMPWLPKRGVYFFREAGEDRTDTGAGPRIVRVGIGPDSASESKLRKRLDAHRGKLCGGGDHRRSIFRKHVGRALIRRDGLDVDTWGDPKRVDNPRELPLEHSVSRIIRDMPFIWLSIDDGSQRCYIEQNSIALLSNYVERRLTRHRGNGSAATQ